MSKVLPFAMRLAVGLAVFCNLLTCAQAQQPVFYFAAHEDDWQLFMGSQAFSDSTQNVKFVFVTLTSGDGGNDPGYGTTPSMVPYYLAREAGSIASVKFLADYQTTTNTGQITNVAYGAGTINGHYITKIKYRNIDAFYFRLPDGGLSGTGTQATGYQSLQISRTCALAPTPGCISQLSSVDGKTVYQNWSDLTETIRQLVANETGTSTSVWINLPNTNQNYNPGDHSDHYYTSYAAQDALTGETQFNFRGFMDYNAQYEGANLTADQIENKAALFGTENYVLDLDGSIYTTWEPWHKQFLSREYFQVFQPGS